MGTPFPPREPTALRSARHHEARRGAERLGCAPSLRCLGPRRHPPHEQNLGSL
ncbi:hypothetical protein ACFPRL_27760 [Pseudoclavibacter helvolus]